jgi:hypothetical protein
LFEQYKPLAISNGKELLDKWLKTKAEARVTLNKLIEKGELKVETTKTDQPKPNNNPTLKKQFQMASEIIGVKPDSNTPSELDYPPTSDKTITGESLYSFKGDYKFIKEFKDYADRYEPNLGLVYADDEGHGYKEHLDRELLISEQTGRDGKPSFFSFSGLALESLKRAFEQTQIIKETEKDGESVLELESNLAGAYKESRDELIKGYGTLLAFKELFDRLSKTYEIDLTYKVNKWLKGLSNFIDFHNDALKTATGKDNKGLGELLSLKKEIKLKDDLFIDKEKIEPDKTRAGGYFKEFEKGLGEDF